MKGVPERQSPFNRSAKKPTGMWFCSAASSASPVGDRAIIGRSIVETFLHQGRAERDQTFRMLFEIRRSEIRMHVVPLRRCLLRLEELQRKKVGRRDQPPMLGANRNAQGFGSPRREGLGGGPVDVRGVCLHDRFPCGSG